MDATSYPLPAEPQNISRILDNSLFLYRKSFLVLLPLMFFFSIFSYSTYFLAYAPIELGAFSAIIREYYIAYLVIQSTILSALLMAILYRLHAFTFNLPCNSLDAFSISLRKLLPFLICIALQGIVIGGMFLPNLLPEYQYNPVAWIVSFIASILFIYIFPAVILFTTHKITVFNSFKRSITLMSGHFWRMTNFYSVVLVLYAAVAFGISILFFALMSYGILSFERADLVQTALQALILMFFGGFIYSSLIISIYDLELRAQDKNKTTLSL